MCILVSVKFFLGFHNLTLHILFLEASCYFGYGLGQFTYLALFLFLKDDFTFSGHDLIRLFQSFDGHTMGLPVLRLLLLDRI